MTVTVHVRQAVGDVPGVVFGFRDRGTNRFVVAGRLPALDLKKRAMAVDRIDRTRGGEYPIADLRPLVANRSPETHGRDHVGFDLDRSETAAIGCKTALDDRVDLFLFEVLHHEPVIRDKGNAVDQVFVFLVRHASE